MPLEGSGVHRFGDALTRHRDGLSFGDAVPVSVFESEYKLDALQVGLRCRRFKGLVLVLPVSRVSKRK